MLFLEHGLEGVRRHLDLQTGWQTKSMLDARRDQMGKLLAKTFRCGLEGEAWFMAS